MSTSNEDNLSSHSQLPCQVFAELLDSIIVDVASESHRIARLGLDRNLDEEEEELRLSAQARARVADPSNSDEITGKYVVDIFGQTHAPVANQIFDCMNCGRSIMAGRFAPHLEKCMGKGRKARLKATRSKHGCAEPVLKRQSSSQLLHLAMIKKKNGVLHRKTGCISLGISIPDFFQLPHHLVHLYKMIHNWCILCHSMVHILLQPNQPFSSESGSKQCFKSIHQSFKHKS